jgi:hypothetical protein
VHIGDAGGHGEVDKVRGGSENWIVIGVPMNLI